MGMTLPVLTPSITLPSYGPAGARTGASMTLPIITTSLTLPALPNTLTLPAYQVASSRSLDQVTCLNLSSVPRAMWAAYIAKILLRAKWIIYAPYRVRSYKPLLELEVGMNFDKYSAAVESFEMNLLNVLPTDQALLSTSSVKIFNEHGTDVTTDMLVATVVVSPYIRAVIRGGTSGKQYSICYYGRTPYPLLIEERATLLIR